MRPPTLLLAIGILLVSGLGHADEPPRVEVPVVEGIVVDGFLDEAAWKQGTPLSTGSVTLPDATGDTAQRSIQPLVRAVAQDGQLHLAVTCPEPPGTGCGVLVFVARDGDEGLTNAWSLSYRPLNPRVDRYIVRTPRGVDRTHCPLVGALDATQRDHWVAELRVPLAAVGAKPTDPLRLAVVVCTRTPTLVCSAPAGAMWQGPTAWFPLDAPTGGWKDEAPDAKALAADAQAEVQRSALWDAFLQRTHAGIDGLPVADDPQLLDVARKLLAARPDLTPVIQTMLGDLLERVGAFEAAGKRYDAALAAAPGWSEARFGKHVRLFARALLSKPGPKGTTDYPAAFGHIAQAREDADAWRAVGLDLVEGLLRFRACDFPAALPLLTRVAERFPAQALPQLRLERAKKESEPHALERMTRTKEAGQKLPRAKIHTSRGAIVVELFEKDLPNAVNQFVWLSEKGFYDGTRVHHAVPYSHAATGDPLSKQDETMKDAGLGGPGYEVAVRVGKRRPYRGSIGFPLQRRQQSRTAGSNFVLMTGLAVDAAAVAAFGAVVEGQEVADALEAGDRIVRVEILRKTDGWSYRPTGLDGKPAPDPK